MIKRFQYAKFAWGQSILADIYLRLRSHRFKGACQDDPQIEIVAECADGKEAVAAIRRYKPDLVFLDVQMPEMDGFDVLRQVGPGAISAVVFGVESLTLLSVRSTVMGTFLTSSTFSMAKNFSNVGSSFTAASVISAPEFA